MKDYKPINKDDLTEAEKAKVTVNEMIYGQIVVFDSGIVGRIAPRTARERKRDAYMEKVRAKK